ncbi:putative ribonuclease H-like domain-containing protein [Tanacetum coccineum]
MLRRYGCRYGHIIWIEGLSANSMLSQINSKYDIIRPLGNLRIEAKSEGQFLCICESRDKQLVTSIRKTDYWLQDVYYTILDQEDSSTEQRTRMNRLDAHDELHKVQRCYKAVRLRFSDPMIQPEPEGSTQGYPLVSVEVLRYIRVNSFTMKKEILLEPTSNKGLHGSYTQEKGIDYDEVFAPVARIEAIRLFLAYASFLGFIVYQMDVKSAFLYGTIDEAVYVCQPPGFEDPQFPNKVYKVEKALYDLHQAPRAWYETLSTYLIENGFRRGTINKTLSSRRTKVISWLQVQQKKDGIFISQDKYVVDILKKFDFATVKTTSTPMEPIKALIKDEEADSVDVHLYRSMIRSLMYLTASRPDIMFAVCACARDSPFNLEAFSDSDYVGASLDKKSTTGGCQFLGKRLISWQCKKQTIVVNSTTEAKYVAAANCCGHVLWIQNQMLDYGFNFMNTKIYIDNESTICIVKNPMFHSKTKHIEIMHHFIKDCYEKKLIQAVVISESSVRSDLLFNDEDGNGYRWQSQAPRNHGGALAQTRSERVLEKPNEPPLSEGHTSGSGEGSMEHTFELMDTVPPTPHDSPLSGGNTPGSDEGRMELIQELMETCTSLTKRVLALEEAKTAQDRVITRLKLRVKRLEKKRKARTPQPMKRRLFKGKIVHTPTTGVSNVSTPVTTAGVAISTAEPRTPPTTTNIFGDEDLTIAQTLMKMKEEKAKEK